jgi:hypothetical protein
LFILAYSLRNEGTNDVTDHWAAFDDEAQVQRQYDSLLERDDLWSASICAVIESTDYDTE